MRYAAFVSYNHRDKRWATWLHEAIERYRIPKPLVGRASPIGTLGQRIPRVFRDRDELGTSGDLAASVRAALEQSATLIVICSPGAVASRWVNEEIRSFAVLRGPDRIFCLIVGGEPHADRQPGVDAQLECFPPALLEVCAEPLAADVRPGMDGKTSAKLKLLSGILGVDYDALRQREAARRQRRLIWIASASAVGFLVMSALALSAFLSRNEAVRQRDIARQKTMTAERTVGFVKSMFEVADPSEARGSTITAREILDRGADQIEQGLDDEPGVKAELATTLGEVYLGLGLFREGERLIRSTFGLAHGDHSTRARQFVALGDSQTRQGEYDQAIRSYRAALRLAHSPEGQRDDLAPRILVGLGEAQSAIEDFRAAEGSIRKALALDMARLGPRHPDVARDIEALALTAFYEGKLEQARPLYERALAIRIEAQGPRHPRVSENLNTLGAIAYLQRDAATAERFYRQALRADAAVLGPDHPDVAATLNNLARLLLERRAFAEARPLLQRALAINLKQRDETHDDLAFTFANLAIAERGRGDNDAASGLFERALRAARKHKHRNLGPILTDLADLDCRRGQTDRGLARLGEAAVVVRADYPDDPWRMAWVQNTRGACLAAAGHGAEARRTFAQSRQALQERWAPGSLYATMAAERQSRLAR